MNEREQREERDDRDEDPRGRETSGGSGISRKRRLEKRAKKRRLPRGASTRSRKRSKAGAPATRRAMERGPAPEPPSILPQPSLDSPEEEPSVEQRPEQEPPPPTAFAPGGDSDDLFEYFF